jgi:recombination protein RecT
MSNTSNRGGGLAARVADKRQQAENGAGTDVATRDQPQTMEEFLDRMQLEMERILPAHIGAERLARIVLTEVRKTPNLAKCTKSSFYGALMTCAQLGLEPGGPSGEAWFVPFKNTRKNCYEVQLIIGYKGMAKLFWQSPLARSLDAQVVHENDVFDFEYGFEPRLVHKPLLKGDRGPVLCYYAVAKVANGGGGFVVMSPDDIAKIRERSRAKDDGPWKTDEDAMSKKTCVRQLAKLIPQSPQLAQAIAQDGAVRTDLSEQGIDVPPEYPDAVEGEVVDDEPDEVAAGPAQGRQARPQHAQSGMVSEVAEREGAADGTQASLVDPLRDEHGHVDINDPRIDWGGGSK